MRVRPVTGSPSRRRRGCRGDAPRPAADAPELLQNRRTPPGARFGPGRGAYPSDPDNGRNGRGKPCSGTPDSAPEMAEPGDVRWRTTHHFEFGRRPREFFPASSSRPPCLRSAGRSTGRVRAALSRSSGAKRGPRRSARCLVPRRRFLAAGDLPRPRADDDPLSTRPGRRRPTGKVSGKVCRTARRVVGPVPVRPSRRGQPCR